MIPSCLTCWQLRFQGCNVNDSVRVTEMRTVPIKSLHSATTLNPWISAIKGNSWAPAFIILYFSLSELLLLPLIFSCKTLMLHVTSRVQIVNIFLLMRSMQLCISLLLLGRLPIKLISRIFEKLWHDSCLLLFQHIWSISSF